MTRVPQGGLPRPRSKYPASQRLMLHETIVRQPNGTYRQSWSMLSRYSNFVQVGVALICVMDDFGFLQVIREEPRPWY